MATEVRWRKGTAAEHESFTGAPAEVSVDTTHNELRVHDGETPGGHRLASVGDGPLQVPTNEALGAPPRTVASIAELRALNATNRPVLVLSYHGPHELGYIGGGDFYWVEGDQSENVAADPLGGIFVARNSDPNGLGGCWKRRLDGGVTPEMFGATGSGDEWGLLQAMFNAAPINATVRIENKHLSNRQIVIRKPLKVLGAGKIYAEDFQKVGGAEGEALIRIEGARGASITTLNATAKEGQRHITVSSAGDIGPGVTLYLESDGLIPYGREFSWKRQHVGVSKIEGDTLHLDQGLEYTFDLGETVQVYRPNYLDGFEWREVEVEQSERPTTEHPHQQAIEFLWCRNLRVESIRAGGGSWNTLGLRYCADSVITNPDCRLRDLGEGLQYALVVMFSSRVRVIGGTVASTRTALDFSEGDNCIAQHVTSYGNMNTHTGSSFDFEYCTTYGRSTIRAQKMRLAGNKYYDDLDEKNYNAATLNFSEAAANGGAIVTDNLVVQSNPESERFLVRFSPYTVTGVTPKYRNTITGNTLKAASVKSRGFRLQGDNPTNALKGFAITGNHLTCGDQGFYLVRIEEVLINNNFLELIAEGEIQRAINSYSPAGSDSYARDVVVSGNLCKFNSPSIGRFVDFLGGGHDGRSKRVSVVGNVVVGADFIVNWGGAEQDILVENNMPREPSPELAQPGGDN